MHSTEKHEKTPPVSPRMSKQGTNRSLKRKSADLDTLFLENKGEGEYGEVHTQECPKTPKANTRDLETEYLSTPTMYTTGRLMLEMDCVRHLQEDTEISDLSRSVKERVTHAYEKYKLQQSPTRKTKKRISLGEYATLMHTSDDIRTRRLSQSYSDTEYLDDSCRTSSAYDAFLEAMSSPKTQSKHSDNTLTSPVAGYITTTYTNMVDGSTENDAYAAFMPKRKPKHASRHPHSPESDVAESLVKMAAQISECKTEEVQEAAAAAAKMGKPKSTTVTSILSKSISLKKKK